MIHIQFKNGRRLIVNRPETFIEFENGCIVLRQNEKIIGVFSADRIQAVFETKK